MSGHSGPGKDLLSDMKEQNDNSPYYILNYVPEDAWTRSCLCISKLTDLDWYLAVGQQGILPQYWISTLKELFLFIRGRNEGLIIV